MLFGMGNNRYAGNYLSSFILYFLLSLRKELKWSLEICKLQVPVLMPVILAIWEPEIRRIKV
jgi:hypothetical protein